MGSLTTTAQSEANSPVVHSAVTARAAESLRVQALLPRLRGFCIRPSLIESSRGSRGKEVAADAGS